MAQKISRRTLAKAVADKLADPKVNSARLAKSLAAYLIENHMTEQLEMLMGDIAYELARRETLLFASVTSAHELSASLQDAVRDLLSKKYQVKKVELATATDPSLIGGMVIETPDAALDLSVRAKLRRLQQV